MPNRHGLTNGEKQLADLLIEPFQKLVFGSSVGSSFQWQGFQVSSVSCPILGIIPLLVYQLLNDKRPAIVSGQTQRWPFYTN
jgi:hypothetical protein